MISSLTNGGRTSTSKHDAKQQKGPTTSISADESGYTPNTFGTDDQSPLLVKTQDFISTFRERSSSQVGRQSSTLENTPGARANQTTYKGNAI
jgi:hypothetical protein